jgi:hypothetical protein
MRISNDTIEFEDSGWSVASTDDNRIKVEHDNGSVYYFNDVGELASSSIDVESVSTDDIRTETIGAGERHYAGDYDGVDQEARLDAALSAAVSGDVIYLENATYGDRTISDGRITLVGTGTRQDGTEIGNWTLDASNISLQNISMGGSGSLTVNGRFNRVENVNSGSITVDEQEAIIMGCHAVDVTLNSITCAVGILADDSTVTDNGSSNSVGVIA